MPSRASRLCKFEAIGYDTILVFPGASFAQGGGAGFFGGGLQAQTLNLDALRQIPQVAQLGSLRIETAMVTSTKMEGQGFLRVTGLGPGVKESFGGYFRYFVLEDGRAFEPEDQFVAVLGNRLATDLGVTVGDEISIDNPGLIGLIGGAIGVLCGVVISSGASGFITRALAFGSLGGGAGAEFSPELIIGTLIFSFVLGALSGVLPARQAAQLRPVEALRYE